jgi:hypothetical protein
VYKTAKSGFTGFAALKHSFLDRIHRILGLTGFFLRKTLCNFVQKLRAKNRTLEGSRTRSTTTRRETSWKNTAQKTAP